MAKLVLTATLPRLLPPVNTSIRSIAPTPPRLHHLLQRSPRTRAQCTFQVTPNLPPAPSQNGRGEPRSKNETSPATETMDAPAEEDFETCEVVLGSDVTLGDGGELEQDQFGAYLIKALKNNTGASVLFLTDVLGFDNGDSRDFAYRIACFGYNVLVPDLFRGVPWRSENPKEEYEKWRELHQPDRVERDIDVATRYLVKNFGSGGKIGVIGFCFGGGRLIEILARDEKSVFSAGAFLYGTRFERELAKRIRAPVLLITGDADELCTTETLFELQKMIAGSKLKIYHGFGHAFAHHPKSAQEDEAAEDAFNEVKKWFHEHLLAASEEVM